MNNGVKRILSALLIFVFVTFSIGFATIAVKSLKFNASTITIQAGKTYQLKVILTPANTTQKLLYYSTSNKNVATVDKNGLVKGINAGKTIITATSASNKNIIGKCTVTVQAKTLTIVTPPGQFPIVNKKMTVQIFSGLPKSNVGDLNTNAFTKWYEEKTNVHIKWMQAGPDVNQIKEKANLMLASGDLPDAFMNAGMTDDQIVLYGLQGVFIPLNKHIANYAPNLKDVIDNKAPYSRDAITANDGNIYALPYIAETYHTTMPQKMWIYKPWLDKLGLKMPETTEEFYEVLKAFKTQDPNGNGKNDEIPLAGATGSTTGMSKIDGFLMQPFVYNSLDKLVINNGKIEFTPTLNGWKDGLRYMKKLYSEKLLAPESFTQDEKQFKQMGENKTPILGAATALWYGIFTINGGDSGRYMQYIAVPPLKGPTGIRQTLRNNFNVIQHTMITKRCKYPEVIVRLADWTYDTKNLPNSWFGPEGIGWEKPKEGEKGYTGAPALYKAIDTFGTTANNGWYHLSTGYQSNAYREGAVSTEPDISKYLEYRLWKYTKEDYAPYAKKEILPLGMFMNEDQAAKNAEIWTSIDNYVTMAMIKFVTGEWDFDKQWDNYVNELNKLGAKDYVKIRQDIYNQKMKNRK